MDRGERHAEPERVRGHVPGVGEQRERSGRDADDDLHDEERDDEEERDEQWTHVPGTGAHRGRAVAVRVIVAVLGRSHDVPRVARVAQVLEPDVEQHADVAIVERRIDHATGAARAHHACRPKPPERVRHRGLARVDGRGQVTDAELPRFEQRAEDARTCRVAEDAEPLGESLDLGAGRHPLARGRDAFRVDEAGFGLGLRPGRGRTDPYI